MDLVRKTTGLAAALLFVVQGVTSLALPPSAGNSYSGTTGDVVNDTVFVVALALLAAFLVLDGRRSATSGAFISGLLAGVGCLMLAVSTLVTVVAGHERWDLVFIVGFALAELGFLATVVGRRSLGYAAMVLGMVLVLAFFDTAGGIALGVGVALATREISQPSARAPSASSAGDGPEVSRR